MKQAISTPDAPDSPALLSQAIIANGTIYVAGQIHMTPAGKLVEGSLEDKVRQIMKNLEAILKAAGADWADVVKATVYVTDINDLPKLNPIYAEYFSEPRPAREGICVKVLPLGASVEISLIAVQP